jgi:hypothetical protein
MLFIFSYTNLLIYQNKANDFQEIAKNVPNVLWLFFFFFSSVEGKKI